MRLKRLLLIDAVKWADVYEPGHRLRDVDGWFRRALGEDPTLSLQTCSIEADLEAALNQEIDGVIISGSPRDAWSDDPAGLNLLHSLKICETRQVPVLGVCYGHQILARFLGGKVDRHPQGLQLYTGTIHLRPDAMECPLFEGLGPSFPAISGHADSVHSLPDGCQWLAESKDTPIQAFHYENLFFGVQFHPEFTGEIIQYLWSHRLETWRSMVTFDLGERIDNLKDAPGTQHILTQFARTVVT
ncbi:MAG: gamma-glutamyl-gamma-aminobutyrate hydrolase family protein [Verrucomicrobiales bacterium]